MKSSPSFPISNVSEELRKARSSPGFGRCLATGLLLCAVGCESPTAPLLQAGESCAGERTTALAAFEDANLEARVRSALGLGSGGALYCGRLAALPELDASASDIASLVGIQNLTGLTTLDISGNPIGDLRPLESLSQLRVLLAGATEIATLSGAEGLTGLTFLDVSENAISDLDPVAGLTSLFFLELSGNAISDLSPLSGLTLLRFVYVSDNAVTDTAPLSGLESLSTLHLDGNELTDTGPLSALTGLTNLSLRANSITDLLPLRGLESLSSLDLSENIFLSDVEPLLDNLGLGTGDLVNLRDTAVTCPDVNALRAKGADVESGCPLA